MTTHHSIHPLDAALALSSSHSEGAGQYTGHTSPAYWNMVGPFGGITAATLAGLLCGMAISWAFSRAKVPEYMKVSVLLVAVLAALIVAVLNSCVEYIKGAMRYRLPPG